MLSDVIAIYFVLFRDDNQHDFVVNESVKSIDLFWLLRKRLELLSQGLLIRHRYCFSCLEHLIHLIF